MDRQDVVIVGGGHNALVAAAYLARAGLRTLLLERLPDAGGAAVSRAVFSGHAARLSRYSYLVSLLPDSIAADLGLRLELRTRPVASYSPVARSGRDTGLLVERDPGLATQRSFREVTGGTTEYEAWRMFYSEIAAAASALAPTFTQPLPTAAQARALIGKRTWAWLVERPLGEHIEATFSDDVVRGAVLTDALIGTFADAHDPTLRQNRCLLYHLMGNGSGEWKVPVGGMGALSAELDRAARSAGAVILTGAEVTRIDSDGTTAHVSYRSGDREQTVAARWALAGVAPAVLDGLLGRGGDPPEGSQLKINALLRRLPQLRSGIDPRLAFAGTLHIAEGYENLQTAYRQAASGKLPETLPLETYCHTLTDPSILGAAEPGPHTLTMFGMHTPARLFSANNELANNEQVRAEAVRRCFEAVDAALAEPLADCLAVDADGRPCVEARSPVDLERELAMPGGHIFHGDLDWPWAPEEPESAAAAWGVATDVPNVLVCGAGARRGGGVSGIGGHNAAMAVLGDAARVSGRR